MADYIIPSGGSGGNTAGAINWKSSVADYASLPGSGNSSGDARITLDTSDIWIWNGSAWVSHTAGAIALTNAHILVGNASNVATDVAMSGDITISNTGVTTIGASKVTEAMQVLADNTTNDVSTTKHGYAPKAPNDATKYLDGTGAWSVPAGGGGGSLPAPQSNVNGSQIDLSGTPQALATLSLSAPSGSSDDYLVWYSVSEDFLSITTTGPAHSVYALSTGGSPFATATGAYLGTTSGIVDAPGGGSISGVFPLNITGAATLNLLGAVSGFANVSAGTWSIYTGLATLVAIRVRENA